LRHYTSNFSDRSWTGPGGDPPLRSAFFFLIACCVFRHTSCKSPEFSPYQDLLSLNCRHFSLARIAASFSPHVPLLTFSRRNCFLLKLCRSTGFFDCTEDRRESYCSIVTRTGSRPRNSGWQVFPCLLKKSSCTVHPLERRQC